MASTNCLIVEVNPSVSLMLRLLAEAGGSFSSNIFIHHLINMNDRIKMLYFICSLISFDLNFEGKKVLTHAASMNISKMAAWRGYDSKRPQHFHLLCDKYQ